MSNISESKIKKGGLNSTYQIQDRPADPQPIKSQVAPGEICLKEKEVCSIRPSSMEKEMRDPKRIEKVLATIRDAWVTCPDLRLGQIMVNATPGPSDDVHRPLFYLEDDVLEKRIKDDLLRGKK